VRVSQDDAFVICQGHEAARILLNGLVSDKPEIPDMSRFSVVYAALAIAIWFE
jgi:hypothetical protein